MALRMVKVYRGRGQICATRGWISVDRGSKATLPLIIPHRVFKSSVKDLARRLFGISLQGGRAADPLCKPWPSTCARGGASAPTVGREAVGRRKRCFSSLDSELEVFSHNPHMIASRHWLFNQAR